MSSYWDALIRTATGAPGSAAPRPRALFEADAGRDAAPDGFETMDEELEAPAPSAAPSPVRRSQTTATAADADQPPARRLARQAEPNLPLEARAEAPSPEHSAVRAEAAATVPPAEAARASPPAATPPPETPRLVERLETLRTVVEADARPASRDTILETETIHHAGPAVLEAPVPDQPRAEPVVAVAAEPMDLPAAPESRPASADAPAPQPLVIEIDRIEVRIVADSAAIAPAPRRRDTGAAPALNDWLTRRGGANS